MNIFGNVSRICACTSSLVKRYELEYVLESKDPLEEGIL